MSAMLFASGCMPELTFGATPSIIILIIDIVALITLAAITIVPKHIVYPRLKEFFGLDEFLAERTTDQIQSSANGGTNYVYMCVTTRG